MSASSLSSSPPRFCRSCAAPVPSSDRSSFCDSPSGFPSDVPAPPCVWTKTGMSPCLCPPTRYCPSCRRFLKGPAGTGTNESSFCCLLETTHSGKCYNFFGLVSSQSNTFDPGHMKRWWKIVAVYLKLAWEPLIRFCVTSQSFKCGLLTTLTDKFIF